MYAMSPLRNAGVFEALLRLSCMTCPRGVHVGRSTWKTAHRSRKSEQQHGSLPEFLKSGAGGLPAISEGKGNRAPGHLMSSAQSCLRAVVVRRGIGWEFVHVCIDDTVQPFLW